MKAQVDRDSQLDHTCINYLVTTALGNVFSDFLTDRAIRGLRPATLDFYKRELRQFITWGSEAGLREVGEVGAAELRAYFLALGQRRNRQAVLTNYGAVKTWLKWAWIEYDLQGACPIDKVKVARPDTQPKPAVELSDVDKLLTVCKGQNAKRDKAILLFLIDTGVRRRELCALEVSALRSNGVVQLQPDGTKTGEARPAFLSRDTQKALKAYLTQRGDLLPGAALFATDEGEPFSVSGLRQVIRRLCAAAGIPEQGLHKFRRTFAIESWRAGADVESVSRMLGHRQLQTTRRYLPLNEDDLRAVHDRTSPVDKLKKGKR